MCERHVCGVAALSDEDTPEPRGVVARIKGVPAAAEINLDPRGKIVRRIRRWKANVGNVTGAVASRDIQTATKGNGKMSVVTTHSVALSVCFKCRSGLSGMLVTELYVIVYEVADGLYPRPTKRGVPEKAPSLVG